MLMWLGLAAALLASMAQGHEATSSTQAEDHWVSSWATAQDLAPRVTPEWFKALPKPSVSSPIPPIPERFNNQTVRMIAQLTIGGGRIRVELSNAYGRQPLQVGAAHVALHTHGSGIDPKSDRALSFAGRATFTLAPGAVMVSDPVELPVSNLAEVAVSLYVPGDSGPPTVHELALHTTYVADGDATSLATLSEPSENKSYFWLTSIDVLSAIPCQSIIALGDSITDGFATTPDANRDWPALLAQRLLSRSTTPRWSVLNLGVSG